MQTVLSCVLWAVGYQCERWSSLVSQKMKWLSQLSPFKYAVYMDVPWTTKPLHSSMLKNGSGSVESIYQKTNLYLLCLNTVDLIQSLWVHRQPCIIGEQMHKPHTTLDMPFHVAIYSYVKRQCLWIRKTANRADLEGLLALLRQRERSTTMVQYIHDQVTWWIVCNHFISVW